MLATPRGPDCLIRHDGGDDRVLDSVDGSRRDRRRARLVAGVRARRRPPPTCSCCSAPGQGKTLTLLVNDSGTIRCNGGKARPISDPLLLEARDLAKDLDQDVQDNRRFPQPAKVFSYRVTLQDGTLSFSDAAAAGDPKYPELARAELFAAQAAQGPCGLTG